MSRDSFKTPETAIAFYNRYIQKYVETGLNQPLDGADKTQAYRYRNAQKAHPEWQLPMLPDREQLRQAAKQQADSAAVKAQVIKMRAFAVVFRDQSITNDDALLQNLNARAEFNFLDVEAVYEFASQYREYAVQQREVLQQLNLELPSLPYRSKGQRFRNRFNDEIEAQLRRYEKRTADGTPLHACDGLLITAAQFDAGLNRDTWQSMLTYQKFAQHVLGKRYEIVVLPIAFGPIKLDAETGQLKGVFAEELEGYIIRETTWVRGLLLYVSRMSPTAIGSYLTSGLLDTLQNEQADVTVFPTPIVESTHRPTPGPAARGHVYRYPRKFMGTPSITRPNYHIDNLHLPSRQGEIASRNHTYGFILAEFRPGGVPFCYDVIDVEGNGKFHTINRHDGTRKVVRVAKGDAKFVSGQVDTIETPDLHFPHTHPEVHACVWGRHGLVAELSPVIATYNDTLNGGPFSRHADKDLLTQTFDSLINYRAVRQRFPWDQDLQDLFERTTGWGHPLRSAQAELAGTALLLMQHHRYFPHTELVQKQSNHVQWLFDYVNSKAFLNSGPAMLLLVTSMLQDMYRAMFGAEADCDVFDLLERVKQLQDSGELDPLNYPKLDPAWAYLRRYLNKYGPGVHIDPGRIMFLDDTDDFRRPLNAPMRWQVASHGHNLGKSKRFRAGPKKGPESYGTRLIIGHVHNSGIDKHGRRAGTATPRGVDYQNSHGSDWTHECVLLFANGQAMNYDPWADQFLGID